MQFLWSLCIRWMGRIEVCKKITFKILQYSLFLALSELRSEDTHNGTRGYNTKNIKKKKIDK